MQEEKGDKTKRNEQDLLQSRQTFACTLYSHGSLPECNTKGVTGMTWCLSRPYPSFIVCHASCLAAACR